MRLQRRRFDRPSVGPTNVNVGDSFTCTVTLTNVGHPLRQNVVARNSLPAAWPLSAHLARRSSRTRYHWPTLARLRMVRRQTLPYRQRTQPRPVHNIASPRPPRLIRIRRTTRFVRSFASPAGCGSAQFGILAGTNTLIRRPAYLKSGGRDEHRWTTVAVWALCSGLRSGVTLYNATARPMARRMSNMMLR